MASKSRKKEPESSGFSEIINRLKTHPFLFGGTIVVLAIVIVAFVFVPALPNIGGGQNQKDLIFGYYNGIPISYVYGNYFQRTLDEIANSWQFQINSDYSLNSNTAYQVWYQAFVRTMVHTAMMDEMKNAGYLAPAQKVDRLVAELPDFQEEGRFSIVRYRSFDKNRLLSIWQRAEENYITGKYINSLANLKVSSAEKAFIGSMASLERSFEMVSFPRTAFPDSELSAFAAANPDLFKIIHLSRITTVNEKEARQVLDSIQSGRSTFEDAARNQSTDTNKDRGGDMGLFMAYEVTEISEETDRNTVLSLKRSEISPVVKVPNGWGFFRAEEAPYVPDLSLPENLGKVRTYMDRFEGGRIENWLVARAEELLAQAQEQKLSLSAYIATLSDEFALQLSSITLGPVNLNYGNMGGSNEEMGIRLFPHTLDVSENPELQDAVSNENFWRTAFSIPLNTPSAPFTLGNSIVILTATEEIISDEANSYIADFYTTGWIYNTLQMDLNSFFLESPKLENHFMDVFLPLLFQDTVSSGEQ
jgi:hypothetical protein